MVFENWIRVLTEPKQVFAEEKANANLKKAVIIMFVTGIISGVFEIIADYVHISLFGKLMTLPFFYPSSFQQVSYGNFFGMLLPLPEYLALSFIVGVIVTPIVLLVESGIYYIFAKLLKGMGNFTTQTYLIALFSAPCIVIASALTVIPFLGGVLWLLIGIYEFYLLTLSLRETHQYSTGKAILTWLIPFIIVFVVGGAIFLIWFISTIPTNV